MKFTRKDRGVMRTLIARGTVVGPVTQELLDLAVSKYEHACKMCNHETRELGWGDFIGPAREQIEREEVA